MGDNCVVCGWTCPECGCCKCTGCGVCDECDGAYCDCLCDELDDDDTVWERSDHGD